MIRNFTSDDIGFVFNSWLKSYRNSVFARDVSNTIYFASHHKILEEIAKRGTIRIACNPKDVSQIYGYIAAEFLEGIFVLHYVYIKQPYRHFGIAKALLNSFDHDPSNASCYTHHTKIAVKLAAKYNMIHHPYLLIDHIRESSSESEENTES